MIEDLDLIRSMPSRGVRASAPEVQENARTTARRSDDPESNLIKKQLEILRVSTRD